jgi:hypothetical protein
MLAEHNYWMKNEMPVYNEIARIPLIVHLPGSRRAGARATSLTQTTDLMPTFLDFYGAPTPPHLHGTSLRPVLEGDAPVHDSIIYGYFGKALNATDGRHTYFRNPVQAESIVYAYTAMPSGFHGFLPRENLAAAETGRFLGHTYNIPVYKIPMKGSPPLGTTQPDGAYVARHDLYDLAADPGQERPLDDPGTERRFAEIMQAHLRRVEAPEENFARLGL